MRRFFSSRLFTCPIKKNGRTLSGQMVILTGRYFEACDVNMNMRCWDGFCRKECLRISLLLMLVGDKENNTSLFFKLFSLGKLTWEPIDQESRRVRMAQHRICQKFYNYTLEIIKGGQKKLVRGLVTSERYLDYRRVPRVQGVVSIFQGVFSPCSGIFIYD